MKILVITPLYKLEGRETLKRDTEAIHHLIKHWNSKENVDVRVLFTYLNPGRNIMFLANRGEISNLKKTYKYCVDGIDVNLIEVQQIPFQKQFWSFQNKKIARAINEILASGFSPDIIVAHIPIRYVGALPLVNIKVPIMGVMHYTDIAEIKRNPALIPMLERSFDALYCRSYSLYREASRYKLMNLKEEIIGSGVPRSENCRKRSYKYSSDKPAQLLYVGKLMKRKHADFIIQAVAELRKEFPINLKIVGNGDQLEIYKALCNSLHCNDCVEFIGNMPRENVFKLMDDSDFFVMPSVNETLGLVYLEAMMHGCVSVGTKNEGIDGIIIDNLNGFLVEPNDVNDLKHVLQKMLSMDSEKMDIIAKASYSTVSSYTEEAMSDKYLDLILSNALLYRV